MYHPSRGGVRGGRDQFSWDDVKADKHRENYLGHSIKAPVGRWQKGKDLFWYARDKKSQDADREAMKEEIRRIKEEEEQAMKEALGLAPKRAAKPQGNRLDKHEYSELVKRSSTAEDLGEGHGEAARVHGLGFSKIPRPWEEPSSASSPTAETLEQMDAHIPTSSARNDDEKNSEDESDRKRRKHEERKHGKHDKRDNYEKHGKRDKSEKDDKRKHKRGKESRRH